MPKSFERALCGSSFRKGVFTLGTHRKLTVLWSFILFVQLIKFVADRLRCERIIHTLRQGFENLESLGFADVENRWGSSITSGKSLSSAETTSSVSHGSNWTTVRFCLHGCAELTVKACSTISDKRSILRDIKFLCRAFSVAVLEIPHS